MSTPTVASPADEVRSDDGAILSSTPPPGRPPPILSTASVNADSNGDQERLSSSPSVPPGRPIAAPVSAPVDIETVDRSLAGDGEEPTQPQVGDASSPAPVELKPHIVMINASTNPRQGNLPEEKQDEQTLGFAPLPQRLTGWAAVEKTLTDYDKQEIGGYKEDIDSLLTFTGLYSAVLTAFVIVSFTQLQEDTAAESLKVLRFIANQTSGGTALASRQLADATTLPFQPTITAIRVNVLWFASLAISLSTASFAIFVKQWLREYMAFSSSSPQGQMRVRHLRRSGLEDWRVLGIASMLPLLLQISLALFFVGLCFFTFDIHRTIGITTITIVCAWAFLFITVTLSPIFSVRCPYKTPALAPITTALRIHVYAQFVASIPYLGCLTFTLLWAILNVVTLLIYAPVYLIRHAAEAGGAPSSLWGWTDFLEDFFNSIIDSLESIADHFQTKSEAKIWDEKEASRDGTKDLMILASADTIQDNPEIDEATIAAALDQIQPHWTDATALLVTLFGNRVPCPAFAEGPENTTVDLTTLSLKTRGAIQHLFLRHVASRLIENPDTNVKSPHLYHSSAWALSMLLSMTSSFELDLVMSRESRWKCFRSLLRIQLDGYLDHGTGPLLLLCACTYILRVNTHYSSEIDLSEDMKTLRHAIDHSVQKSTTLSCDSSMSDELGSSAERVARRLMESANNLRSSPHNWSTSTLYYDAVLLALKLCGVVHLAGHRINCEELLGARFSSLVSLRTQAGEGHKEMITLCMSLPWPLLIVKPPPSPQIGFYPRPHITMFPTLFGRRRPRIVPCGFIDGNRYQGDDRASICNAISAIARDAIAGDVAITRILNLNSIALSMEYTQARQWLGKSSTSGTEEPSDRLQMFNLLASALAKARKQNKKNALRAKGNEKGNAVGYCWSQIVDRFITAVHDDLEGLDLASFPYFSYFLLELSLLITSDIQQGFPGYSLTLFKKMQSMSETEKNGIRDQGERYIGRGASSSGEELTTANRGILRSIQDVIRGSARRLPDGQA